MRQLLKDNKLGVVVALAFVALAVANVLGLHPQIGVSSVTDTLKDTWWAGDPPTQKCVETERNRNESNEEFVNRHNELVELQKKACPPVQPPGGGQ